MSIFGKKDGVIVELCPLREKVGHRTILVLKNNNPKEIPRIDFCPVCCGKGILLILEEDR